MAEFAFKEFGETEETRSIALSTLRERINSLENDEDKLADTSDINLIRFIRTRKYDLDLALSTTVALAKFQRENEEELHRINSVDMACYSKFFEIIQEPHPISGARIVVLRTEFGIKMLDSSFLETFPRPIFWQNIWFYDRISRDCVAQVCGLVILVTFKNFTIWDNLTLSRAVSIEDQYQVFGYLQSAIGIRLKAVVLFETPTFVSYMWSLVRLLLTEKLRNRFHVCASEYEILEGIFGGGRYSRCVSCVLLLLLCFIHT